MTRNRRVVDFCIRRSTSLIRRRRQPMRGPNGYEHGQCLERRSITTFTSCTTAQMIVCILPVSSPPSLSSKGQSRRILRSKSERYASNVLAAGDVKVESLSSAPDHTQTRPLNASKIQGNLQLHLPAAAYREASIFSCLSCCESRANNFPIFLGRVGG